MLVPLLSIGSPLERAKMKPKTKATMNGEHALLHETMINKFDSIFENRRTVMGANGESSATHTMSATTFFWMPLVFPQQIPRESNLGPWRRMLARCKLRSAATRSRYLRVAAADLVSMKYTVIGDFTLRVFNRPNPSGRRRCESNTLVAALQCCAKPRRDHLDGARHLKRDRR
jgi:hypothetical protein